MSLNLHLSHVSSRLDALFSFGRNNTEEMLGLPCTSNQEAHDTCPIPDSGNLMMVVSVRFVHIKLVVFLFCYSLFFYRKILGDDVKV